MPCCYFPLLSIVIQERLFCLWCSYLTVKCNPFYISQGYLQHKPYQTWCSKTNFFVKGQVVNILGFASHIWALWHKLCVCAYVFTQPYRNVKIILSLLVILTRIVRLAHNHIFLTLSLVNLRDYHCKCEHFLIIATLT